MWRQVITAGLAAGASAMSLPVADPGCEPPPPAPPPARYELSGNFAGGPEAEWLSYGVGTAPDRLYVFDNGGVFGGPLTIAPHGFAFEGADGSIPVHPNFGAYDNLVQYGPGDKPDLITTRLAIDGGPTFTTTLSPQVGGNYQPLAGDFTGDGVEDLLWYAPGPTPDPLWDYNPGPPGTPRTIVELNVNGTYRPVVASIGKDATDDIVWYGPGSTPDTLWDFSRGSATFTTQTLSIGGTDLEPVVFDGEGDGWRGDDILWFGPTADVHPVWDYTLGVRSERTEAMTGPFHPTAGDYFGDGQEDILWASATRLVLWDHNATDRFVYDRPL
jgi:hypothetical protein